MNMMVKSLIVAHVILAVAFATDDGLKGTADMRPTANTKTSLGGINFYSDKNQTVINGTITGLNATTNGNHGFTIHEVGNFTSENKDCSKIGGHYNPLDKDHGDIKGTVRHIGDLGNIDVTSDKKGTFAVTITIAGSSAVPLNGNNTVIGKVLVIHEKPDDLGKGKGDSKVTGNVGKPLACGLIGKYQKDSAGSVIPTVFTFVTLILAKLM